ncbi:MAG: alginate export family protein [Planctomycetes bacterium]|nr:alginate export family protein [Planctomycetota bacterium]
MRHTLPFWALASALALGTQVEAQNATAPGVDSLEISGSFRLRGETRIPDTGSSTRTYGARARLRLDSQVDDFISAALELQWNGTAGAAVGHQLHQGFFTLADLFNVVDLQVGRFEMKYGNQRMVSPLDWSNFGRSWDGARFSHNAPDYNLDVFITKPVIMQGATGGATPNGNRNFNGLYYERTIGDINTDFYFFNRQDGVRDDFTIGFLLDGAIEEYTWSAELAKQFGDSSTVGADADGYALALRTDTKLDGDFKVGLGFEYASGQDSSSDSTAFAPLFGFDHKYQGNMDLFGWTNLMDLAVRTGAPIDDNWGWYGDLHLFSQPEEEVAGESFLGTEIDLGLKGHIGQNAMFWGGISHFLEGDDGATVSSGAALEDQTWLFAQVGVKF